MLQLSVFPENHIGLSICVPSKNRHDELERFLLLCVPQLLKQDEIIIYDQSEKAFSCPTRLQHANLRIIHDPHCTGLPQARNRLAHLANRQQLLYCDDDMLLAPNFLAELRKEHKSTSQDHSAIGPIVECRPLQVRRAHRLLQLGAQRDERRFFGSRSSRSGRLLFGCCFCISRELVLHHGFRENWSSYAFGEDRDFFERASIHTRYLSTLRALHKTSPKMRAKAWQRGLIKGQFIAYSARHYSEANPATLIHAILAVIGSMLGEITQSTREAATPLAILRGFLGQNRPK